MIIDAHAHLYHPRWYPEPFQAYLARDFAIAGKKNGRTNTPSASATQRFLAMLADDTGEKTLRIMDAVGIDTRVILIVDWGIALGEATSNIWQIHDDILKICAQFPDRFIGFAGVDPRRDDAVDIVRKAVEQLGAAGLKLHPTSEWRLDDERTHQVVDVVATSGLPVVVHIGETIDILSSENATPSALMALAASFPTAQFLVGHSGFDLWKVFVAQTNPPPNVYFDISGWQQIIGRDSSGKETLLELLRHFPGHVCFGTDAPFYGYNIAAAESQWLKLVTACLKEASDPPSDRGSSLFSSAFLEAASRRQASSSKAKSD